MTDHYSPVGNALFVQLVNMRNAAGRQHFARIQLADKLLKDREWVRAPHGGGGDESRAIDRLESECFADLCGAIGLPQMLEILHHFPDESKWRDYKFNLGRMWSAVQSRRRPEAKKTTPAKERARAGMYPTVSFQHLPPREKDQEYQKAARIVESQAGKVETLEQENARLRKKVADHEVTIQRQANRIVELEEEVDRLRNRNAARNIA